MRVEQVAQRGQLAPLDRVGGRLEPGVHEHIGVRMGGGPVGVAVVARDGQPRVLLGQRLVEHVLLGALAAGAGQHRRHDEVAGAVSLTQLRDLPVEDLAKRHRVAVVREHEGMAHHAPSIIAGPLTRLACFAGAAGSAGGDLEERVGDRDHMPGPQRLLHVVADRMRWLQALDRPFFRRIAASARVRTDPFEQFRGRITAPWRPHPSLRIRSCC